MENRTSRLSVLVDPKKKAAFEQLCMEEDMTPSQVIRRMMRDFIECRLGETWKDQVFADGKVDG